MRNNKNNRKNIAEDVLLVAAINRWLEWLTDLYMSSWLDVLKEKSPEKIEKCEKPKREKFKKNGLFDATIFDTLFLLVAILCSVYTEILLSQTIFEKVLGITLKKATYMGWGMAVILFTGAMLIKPMVKDFLRKKPVVPKFFKIGMFVVCSVMFVMGGLSYYNIKKNSHRKDIIALSQRIDDAKEVLEDDPSNTEKQEELAALEAKRKTTMQMVDNTPPLVEGSSFLALSLLSLVMLFCSSFLKAVTVLYLQKIHLNTKRRFYFWCLTKDYKKYENLVSQLKDAHGVRPLYLRLMARKVAIESLQAANPVTSEYLKAINTLSDTPPSGLSSHHQTFTP